jgi:D-glycero-D-manno-heptose 1,7-bisphosphate phosphatase
LKRGRNELRTSKASEAMKRNRAIFLDRDGVINEDSEAFITHPDQVIIFPTVSQAIRSLREIGFHIIVVSNQSGVGRGLLSEETLADINGKIQEELERDGAKLDGMYHCPHLPTDGCSCRKPKNGMLIQASRDFDIDLYESYMIGDKPSDIACGESSGCSTILTFSGQSRGFEKSEFIVYPDYICMDLLSASKWILEKEKTRRE